MKNILFIVSLLFCTTYFYSIECSHQQLSENKRNPHSSQEHAINRINAVIQDFTRQYQAIVTAFINRDPDQPCQSNQSFRPTTENGLFASWSITYPNGAKLYCSETYSREEIQRLPQQNTTTNFSVQRPDR